MKPVLHLLTSLGRDRRANVAVMTAILLPALIVASGMGMETGYWFLLNKRGQNAADVAAYAGAVALRNTEEVVQARTVSMDELDGLGFGGPDTTITVNSPPTSGHHINNRSVEVILRYPAPRFISSMVDESPVHQNVRAVAEITPPVNACLLALDIEASRAVTFSGAAKLALTECEVMANSIAADAFYAGGSVSVTAPCVNTVGYVELGGNANQLTLEDCLAPREELPRALDPYRDLPTIISPPACSNLGGGGKNTIKVKAGVTGVKRFCNGLKLSGSYAFDPGIYIIDGGEFRLNANTELTGTGVTFILTGGAEANFNGSARIQVSAPTSGTYAGVLFYGDRSDTTAVHRFNGSADSWMTGTIYTPGAHLGFLGNFSGQNDCMQLIGATIEISGSVEFAIDCPASGIQWANVPGSVRIVE